MDHLAMKLMKEKNYKGAITVFKRNAQAYDTNNFPPNYAWLAEAYEKNGNPEKALEAYQKAYDLSVQTGYGEKQKYHSRIEQLKQSLDQPWQS